MGQANPLALKRTIESFAPVVNDIVFGDMLVFEEDRRLMETYKKEHPLRTVRLPFDYIFKMGFSHTLNTISAWAKNDLVLYMNVSEVCQTGIDKIIQTVEDNPDCNAFYFDHEVEKHRWFRLYDRRVIKWDGLIHEEIQGDINPYPHPLFRMADTDKDSGNEFKASVANSVKEINYFKQYMEIVDYPHKQGITNDWWVNFAKENYESMKERLLKKGKHYAGFVNGDFDEFFSGLKDDDYFENVKFDSSNLIEFQGSTKSL